MKVKATHQRCLSPFNIRICRQEFKISMAKPTQRQDSRRTLGSAKTAEHGSEALIGPKSIAHEYNKIGKAQKVFERVPSKERERRDRKVTDEKGRKGWPRLNAHEAQERDNNKSANIHTERFTKRPDKKAMGRDTHAANPLHNHNLV